MGNPWYFLDYCVVLVHIGCCILQPAWVCCVSNNWCALHYGTQILPLGYFLDLLYFIPLWSIASKGYSCLRNGAVPSPPKIQSTSSQTVDPVRAQRTNQCYCMKRSSERKGGRNSYNQVQNYQGNCQRVPKVDKTHCLGRSVSVLFKLSSHFVCRQKLIMYLPYFPQHIELL